LRGVKSKAKSKRRNFSFKHGRSCDKIIAVGLLIASWQELSDSAISAGWNFDETPIELDSDDSSDDESFVLILDSDSDEWDDTCSNLTSEEDLEVNNHEPFRFEERQIRCKKQFRCHRHS
jgi:hypothetical protein